MNILGKIVIEILALILDVACLILFVISGEYMLAAFAALCIPIGLANIKWDSDTYKLLKKNSKKP